MARRTTLAALAALALGCSSATVTTIGVDETASGTHGPGMDDPTNPVSEHDVYEFVAPENGTYIIQVSGDDQATVTECPTPEWCYCNIATPTCCTVQSGEGACTFFTRELSAGESTYLVTSNFSPSQVDYSFHLTPR